MSHPTPNRTPTYIKCNADLVYQTARKIMMDADYIRKCSDIELRLVLEYLLETKRRLQLIINSIHDNVDTDVDE